MNNRILSLSLLLLSLLAVAYAQKTLLTDVKVLTLEKGKYTAGRRSSPIAQLQCSGAACYSDYEPNIVQCYNQGSDSYGNVQWRCDAQLDQDVQFGKTIVSCEGYDYPDDPYILQGSCGLEYELEYTRLGKQRKNSGSSYYNTGSSGDYYSYKQNSSADLGTWIGIILICVILYAIWNQLQANQNRERYGGNYRPGGADDFGPGGNDHNRNNYPDNKYSTGNNYAAPPAYGYGGAPGYGYGYGGYRPGFWTGFGGGGLLGYLMGSRRGYGTGYGGGYRSYGGGSFGGGSFGGSSGSSGSRSSSGFGGTRRR